MNQKTIPKLIAIDYGERFSGLLPRELLMVAEHRRGILHGTYEKLGIDADGKPTDGPYQRHADFIYCTHYRDCPLNKGGQWGDYKTFTWIEMLIHFYYYHPKIARCKHLNAEMKTEVCNGTWFNQWAYCPDCDMNVHCEQARSHDTWD